MGVFDKISYNPLVIRSVRALGLRSALRKAYYVWARPRNGIMSVRLGEFDCRFHVRTPEQLRIIGKASTGNWRIEVIRFLDDRLRPGDVVYDVGSNIGICSVFAARKVGGAGQLLAFEPAMETYANLIDNMQLNGLTNARTYRVALADYSGEAGLFTGDDLLFSSLVTSRNGQERSQSVRVVQGDRFREEENLPAPDVVMIDVEGFEKGVMSGLRQTLSDSKCRAVIAEVHPTLLPSGETGDDILKIFSSCGFKKIDTLRWLGIPEFYVIAEREAA
jgi:FkbM family methyltransferase